MSQWTGYLYMASQPLFIKYSCSLLSCLMMSVTSSISFDSHSSVSLESCVASCRSVLFSSSRFLTRCCKMSTLRTRTPVGVAVNKEIYDTIKSQYYMPLSLTSIYQLKTPINDNSPLIMTFTLY